MALLTDLAYTCAAAITSPIWGYRLLRTGKWRTDWQGRFGQCPLRSPAGRPTLMIHAVSLGEVNAIRTLVKQLEQQHQGDLRIVISTTTDTGTAQAQRLFGDRHDVVRYPLDFTPAVRRFLDAVQPDVVALVELEVWPNFVAECSRRGVPVLVINGRLSERSYGRYRLIRPLVRRSFQRLAAVAVQDEPYAERFARLGVPRDRLHVTGTMKWDNAQLSDDEPDAAALARVLDIDPQRPLVVCGSTGPGEEVALVEQLATLRLPPHDQPPQILLAPRKPERFDAVADELASRFGAALGPIVRRSQRPDGNTDTSGAAPPPTADRATRATLFLLDSFGELRRAYALADLAVVGRSFAPMHGSDMTEPIALGKPTLIGPHVGDFRDMMEGLAAAGGICQLSGPADVPAAVARLLRTQAGRDLAERGRQVVRARQGASARHAELINRWLNASQPSQTPAST